MAAGELECAVGDAVALREHDLTAQIAPDVFRERIGGGIAFGGCFLQRLDDNRVEVAAKGLYQLLRGRHATGGRGFRLEDRLFERATGVAFEAIGSLADQHFVEHYPQRVDVGGGGNRPAGNLLRSCVLGCHGLAAELCQFGRSGALFLQQFRDSEIQQVDVASCGHQDVGGLQVAMNDQVGVRVLDCAQDLLKELQPLANRQPVRVAVGGERRAVDVLQGEVRLAVFSKARIKEACNAGMVEARQDFPLAGEAFGHDSADQG